MDIEKEATLQGWIPQEQYKGDPEKWVDAEEFVRRGETFMPMIQHANKRLKAKIDELETTVSTLKDSVEASRESMEALKEFHAESTKAQVDKARREILSQLKEAKESGDIEQEIQATADLSRFDAAQVAVKQEAESSHPSVVKPPQPELHPVVKEWIAENPWYSTDPEKAGLMDGAARKLRMEGSPLVGREFLDAAAKIVADRFSDKEDISPVSKVEGGRHTASTGSRASTGYAALPAEAKEMCDRQETKVVGPNRVYKTQKEWREFYASEYFKAN